LAWHLLNKNRQTKLSKSYFWSHTMAALKINDLQINRTLDRKSMLSIKGASGAWVFGWIRPHVRSIPSLSHPGQVVHYVQINNYYAEQMNNQFQMIDVNNTAPNSQITLAVGQVGTNIKP
jgi:hypothetical protein